MGLDEEIQLLREEIKNTEDTQRSLSDDLQSTQTKLEDIRLAKAQFLTLSGQLSELNGHLDAIRFQLSTFLKFIERDEDGT